MSAPFDGNAPVRVVTVPSGTVMREDTKGMLVEIPAMHARPGAVIRSTRTVVVRPAWPYEYRLPLGSEALASTD